MHERLLYHLIGLTSARSGARLSAGGGTELGGVEGRVEAEFDQLTEEVTHAS